MADSPVALAPISLLTTQFASGAPDPSGELEKLIDRIKDPVTNGNAYVHLDAESARAQAEASGARWKQGAPLSEIDGIVVAVKDVLDVKGMPTRHGTSALADVEPALEDSVVASRLKGAGAIIPGKTRTWEFAWRSQPNRSQDEIVPNPWNPAYSPGGSSSGSAAAVALGLCSAAIGTDSGGSVRGPAAFCNLVGLKPSFGRVPNWPATPMMDLEHIGVIAPRVEDCRAVFNVIQGYHPDDPDSWAFDGQLIEPIGRGAEELKIATSVDLGVPVSDTACRARFSDAVEKFKRAGHRCTRVDLDLFTDYVDLDRLYEPMAALSLELLNGRSKEDVDPMVHALADAAGKLDTYSHIRLQQLRLALGRRINRLFEDYDALVSLTQPGPPNRLHEDGMPMRLTRPFDMSGHPAISVPAGFDDNGLPVGLQIVAPRGHDARLLEIAAQLESVLAV